VHWCRALVCPFKIPGLPTWETPIGGPIATHIERPAGACCGRAHHHAPAARGPGVANAEAKRDAGAGMWEWWGRGWRVGARGMGSRTSVARNVVIVFLPIIIQQDVGNIRRMDSRLVQCAHATSAAEDYPGPGCQGNAHRTVHPD
jgi:hypothetical protein